MVSESRIPNYFAQNIKLSPDALRLFPGCEDKA